MSTQQPYSYNSLVQIKGKATAQPKPNKINKRKTGRKENKKNNNPLNFFFCLFH